MGRAAQIILRKIQADVIGNNHVFIFADLPEKICQLQIGGGIAGRIPLRSRACKHNFGRDRVVVRHARAGNVIQIDHHAVTQRGQILRIVMHKALAAYLSFVSLHIVEGHCLIQPVPPCRTAGEQQLLHLERRIAGQNIPAFMKIMSA